MEVNSIIKKMGYFAKKIAERQKIMSKIWNGDLSSNGLGMYQNPVLYGDYSDPDACRAGEDYYMISSSFSNAPGLPLLHSKDLVNWKVVNYILKELPIDRYDKPAHGCGVWAPSIRYHDGTFFACFPMPDEGIYMTTAKDPLGDWTTPVNIRPGSGWEDPCPFWDDDGRAYLVTAVVKSRIGYNNVLYMTEMRPDGMGLIGEEIRVFEGDKEGEITIEGPKLYKRNGWYYIFAPAGGVKTGWQTVLRSKNIFGPYERKIVMRQGDTDINGPHQGAWVDTVTGEDWFLHFQDVYSAGRIVHLQPMRWENDWPIIGEAKNGNDWGEPVLQYRKPNVGAVVSDICEPDTSDGFSGKELGLQWQWNANPKDGWHKLTEMGLQLNAVSREKGIPYGDIPNLLLQKWPAPEFSCTTSLDLSALTDGDTAGVISMGMEYGLIAMKKNGNEISFSFVKGVQKFGRILVEETIEEETELERISADKCDKVTVLYTVKRIGIRDLNDREKGFPLEEVTLEYSFDDGASYKTAGRMNAVPGRWVGVKNGVFCISENKNSEGYLIVEQVEYNR